MSDSETRTEAQVVADLAFEAAEPTWLIDKDNAVRAGVFVVPAGSKVEHVDLEQFEVTPARKRGRVDLFTAASFAEYVKTHDQGAASVYADVNAALVTAVLNGDTAESPGWGDHQAALQLRHTDSWKHWTSRDARLGTQAEFANHIEQGLVEIVEPAAADMLELAQHFQAHTTSEYRTSRRLDNGQVQLTYNEVVDAKAGQAGQLQVPEEFTLALQPFEGSASYRVRARLRYRVSGGQLAIGYQLDRPRDVIQAAFDDVLTEIEDTTQLKPFAGRPPTRG